jgi:hypothetical protein
MFYQGKSWPEVRVPWNQSKWQLTTTQGTNANVQIATEKYIVLGGHFM